MRRKLWSIFLLMVSFLLLLGFQKETFANSKEELDQIEIEREEAFLKQLLLDIPSITDNPSHIITFVDPSENSAGVQLEINDTGFEQIESPYNLPALRIGTHTLRFKFIDTFDSTQILERDIIVIPRPPIINSPSFTDNLLTISGTGLADSELILILSSSKDIDTAETKIDKDGSWKVEIDLSDLSEGLYTFTGYTRRYGYASNLANSITFELGESQNSLLLERNGKKDIYFSFGAITFDNLTQVISNNSDLTILIITTFTLGFILAWLLNVSFRNSSEKKMIKELEGKMNNNENNKSEAKNMTLKEILSKKEEETKEESKDEKKEVKLKKVRKEKTKEKDEKIITKIDFLKDFKKFDPDDDEGKEKNIDIKITSKK